MSGRRSLRCRRSRRPGALSAVEDRQSSPCRRQAGPPQIGRALAQPGVARARPARRKRGDGPGAWFGRARIPTAVRRRSPAGAGGLRQGGEAHRRRAGGSRIEAVDVDCSRHAGTAIDCNRAPMAAKQAGMRDDCARIRREFQGSDRPRPISAAASVVRRPVRRRTPVGRGYSRRTRRNRGRSNSGIPRPLHNPFRLRQRRLTTFPNPPSAHDNA